jgi:CubicO group peptidase (beta-lactamase class C family)
VLTLALAASALHCAPATPPQPRSPVPAPSTRADVPFPSSLAGAAATAWLHAVDVASREDTLAFYKTRYTKALLGDFPPETRRDFVHDHRVLEGKRHVRAIESASETRIVMVLETELTEAWQRLTLEVDQAPPHLIVTAKIEPIAPPGEAIPKDDREAAAVLDGYVTRLCDRGVFSGTVAIARRGATVYEHTCGLASRAFGVPNRIDTKFNLGSMNKMFTAVSIAQLVGAGKLSYQDTLAKAWPEYPNRAVAEKITIHQLLTHTSGLGDYFTEEYERTAKDRLRAIKDYLPLFVDKPLEHDPGTHFRYSNAGFMVLGGVIERVSGEDYFEYVRRHVYAPAGMKDTDAFEMDHDTPNLAIGYTPDRAGPGDPIVPGKVQNNLYMHVVKGGPAGGGFSTVRDLTAFGEALLHGKLAPLEQVTTLTTSRGGPEPTYAYGFRVETYEGQRQIGHGGGFNGINARLDLYPEAELSVAAMANVDPPAAERITARARRLFARGAAAAR